MHLKNKLSANQSSPSNSHPRFNHWANIHAIPKLKSPIGLLLLRLRHDKPSTPKIILIHLKRHDPSRKQRHHEKGRESRPPDPRFELLRNRGVRPARRPPRGPGSGNVVGVNIAATSSAGPIIDESQGTVDFPSEVQDVANPQPGEAEESAEEHSFGEEDFLRFGFCVVVVIAFVG
mmetsp:Transcript_8162/g.17488  ORF Transcript_8162/g.17488 Transcript_8162/m.17488 type:complete len:176 (-) Transcript_8162:371-898(-)